MSDWLHQKDNKKQMLMWLWRKGNPYALLVEIWICVATMENCMEDPKQWKIELPCDPHIPLLVIFPKEVKTASWRHICTSMFFAALFTIAKRRKQPKSLSTDEWIMECYLAMRKKESLPFLVTWMETWWLYAKWNKSERERPVLYNITYIWNL